MTQGHSLLRWGWIPTKRYKRFLRDLEVKPQGTSSTDLTLRENNLRIERGLIIETDLSFILQHNFVLPQTPGKHTCTLPPLPSPRHQPRCTLQVRRHNNSTAKSVLNCMVFVFFFGFYGFYYNATPEATPTRPRRGHLLPSPPRRPQTLLVMSRSADLEVPTKRCIWHPRESQKH